MNESPRPAPRRQQPGAQPKAQNPSGRPNPGRSAPNPAGRPNPGRNAPNPAGRPNPGQSAPNPPNRRANPPRQSAAGVRPQTSPRRNPPPKRRPPQPILTPAQRRMLRQEQKRRRQRAFAQFRFYAAAVLIFYVFFALIAGGVMLIKIHSFPKKEEAPQYNVFFLDKEQNEFAPEPTGTLYKKENLIYDGRLYLEAGLLSSYTNLSEGGDGVTRTVYIGNEYARFYIGTRTVCVNGQYTSLSVPSILRDSHLCVPLDFFEKCVTGIEVGFDEDKERHTFTNTGEILFAIKEPEPAKNIPYEDYLGAVKNSSI